MWNGYFSAFLGIEGEACKNANLRMAMKIMRLILGRSVPLWRIEIRLIARLSCDWWHLRFQHAKKFWYPIWCLMCVSPNCHLKTSNVFSVIMVGRAGFEPATNGLKIHCSTNWANDPLWQAWFERHAQKESDDTGVSLLGKTCILHGKTKLISI